LLWSVAYLVARNLFALVWLLARSRRSEEMEILVLRHELAILRRPRVTRADRTLLASLSRSLARPAWAVFPIKPDTLLRWHRQLIARRWTYSRRTAARARPAQALVGRPGIPKVVLEAIGLHGHWSAGVGSRYRLLNASASGDLLIQRTVSPAAVATAPRAVHGR
jgi:hypothetical protein